MVEVVEGEVKGVVVAGLVKEVEGVEGEVEEEVESTEAVDLDLSSKTFDIDPDSPCNLLLLVD